MSAMPPLIVHVVYRFAIGGLENGVVNLINRLPAQSWRHAVVSLTDVDEAFVARISRSNVRCIALNKAPGHAVRLYPRLVALLRELKPAIVHTRNLAALEAAIPAWIAGVPARLHGEHGRDVGDLDGSNVHYQRVRRLFRPFVTRYVALSPDLERYLRERVGVPAAKIDQIYNGVDTARFVPARGGRAAIDACPFQGPGYWLVGTVGRMEAVKDQTNLARAFVDAINANPEARARLRLVLVGAIVGLGGSLALLRGLGTLLFDVTPYDIPTYASVVVLLAAVAALASYIPARQASRVQPLLALREE
jgi:sugar transferase (PEP-CTERM/EpsH1 system associated)